MRLRQLLSHEGKQRRIREMEQHRADGKQHERTRSHQHPVARRTLARILPVPVEAACPVLVDRLMWDRQRRPDRQHGEHRDQQKDRPLRHEIAHGSGRGRDGHVARMVERRIAAHPPGEPVARIQSQGHGCDRRAEDVADDRHCRVRDQHRPECRRREDDGGPGGQHREGYHDGAALAVRGVDGTTGGCLRDQAQQAADGRHPAYLGLAPVLLGDEKDIEVGTERAAHIRKQEVQRIERPRPEGCLGHAQNIATRAIPATISSPPRMRQMLMAWISMPNRPK